MRPIITSDKFERLDHPRAIAPLVEKNHRMTTVLVTMLFHHPRIWNRAELLSIGGFIDNGDHVTHLTSFHYWMLRINDTLPRTGWRVNDAQGYRLVRVSLEQERTLRARLNGPLAA
ncbi:MAG TPA: hypothetical protein VMF90_12260 [Rhizobiaceae bacterium]|nr:hypothetical protein [Rhizobiaceae bacterium]